ncbi:hypothetical protein [Paradevosia shaoguanensis]|uniref:hypothetical protein n=1 Tax=Paradevosia shaoguanensis TaxID=1335043 RepID=UPI001933FEAA|nr:hypothetical protein [Paradevosia shaoguanensis]
MREKIARKAYVVLHGAKAPEDMSAPYASASKIGKAYEVADAVLDALMEPTDGMKLAGSAASEFTPDEVRPSTAATIFRAMMQAAREGA